MIDITHRDANAISDDPHFPLIDLYSWLSGIDSTKATKDNFQVYLNAYSFIKNKNTIDDLMRILVTDYRNHRQK